MRQPEDELHIIGSFYADSHFTDPETGEECNPKQLIQDSYFILGYLDQGSEPTTHAMQDISAFRNNFEESNLPLIFIFSDQETYNKFKMKEFNELPNNTFYGIDSGSIREEFTDVLHLNTKNLPIFLIANGNSEVIYLKQGYNIGLGEQMLKIMEKLKEIN